MESSDRASTRSTQPQATSAATENKSYDSLVSSKSSMHAAKELYNKSNKTTARVHNMAIPKFVAVSNEVRKRVMSARLLRKKTFHNQLAEAEQTISNLKQENRMLLTIHQRQDAALAKYESASADLPNLLNCHAEELNNWEMKYKKLQMLSKELEEKLKQKESIISNLNEENKHYAQLNKNKNLDTRENLLNRIQHVQQQIMGIEKAEQQALTMLENDIKLAKQQLLRETKKVKEFSTKLEESRKDVSGTKLRNLKTNIPKSKVSKPRVTFDEPSTNDDTDASIPQFPETKTSKLMNLHKLNNSKKITTTISRCVEHGDGDGDVNLLNKLKPVKTKHFLLQAVKTRNTLLQPKSQKMATRIKEIKAAVMPKQNILKNNKCKQGFFSTKSLELEDDDYIVSGGNYSTADPNSMESRDVGGLLDMISGRTTCNSINTEESTPPRQAMNAVKESHINLNGTSDVMNELQVHLAKEFATNDDYLDSLSELEQELSKLV